MFDPFGDFLSAGYLRNVDGAKDLNTFFNFTSIDCETQSASGSLKASHNLQPFTCPAWQGMGVDPIADGLQGDNRAHAERVYAATTERYKKLYPENDRKGFQKFMVY